MTKSDVNVAIRDFISENFLFGVDTEFADEDSFLENGIIDSTGVLELIMFVECTYKISVGDDELVPENLDSVANLERFIVSKQHPAEVTI